MRRRFAFALAVVAAGCGFDIVGHRGEAGLTDDAGRDQPGADGGNAGGDSVTDGGTSADGRPPGAPVDGGADAAPSAGFAVSLAPDAYVAAGALPIPADFTLEAWVNPKTTNGETLIVAKDQANRGNGQFRLGLLGDGRAFFIMTDAGGDAHGLYSNAYQLVSPAAVPVATWTHIAVTKGGRDFRLLLGGGVVDTVRADADFAHGAPTRAFRIGARLASNGTGADSAFDGAIDQVRIFDVARTPAQIAADMRVAIEAGHPAFAQLRASLRFDEGAGTTAADDRAAYPGTLMGGATWVTSGAY